MYIFHFSLATKQPAVTAHRFARSIEEAGASKRVEALAEIVVRTFRSQFVALVGNLLIVVPVALLIADLMFAQTGHYYVGEAKRSEEHTSELQSLMRISYAVFCLKNKKKH